MCSVYDHHRLLEDVREKKCAASTKTFGVIL